MTHDRPHILFVNPWIHDFAAYDFWSTPVGLLRLAAMVRNLGAEVTYVDCLNRFHSRAARIDPRSRHGRGAYLKTPLPPPRGLEDIPRRYSRYGIPEAWLRDDLRAVPRPDLILVTSMMTYWYPGVVATIQVLRDLFPDVPLILGGVYASLCPDHARTVSGADTVIRGPGEGVAAQLIRADLGGSTPLIRADDLDALPYPALDLQDAIPSAPVVTSRGCPFSCAYCASSFLAPRYQRRRPEAVVDEIEFWHHRHGVIDFAFYDDALLVDAENHALPMFEALARRDMTLRFHTPNALHIREISAEGAKLMYAAGFETVRLGLETADFDDRRALDNKVAAEDFKRAVAHLRAAGFQSRQIGAYLLAGLPDQRAATLRQSIATVAAAGITPILAYYTPIPHTPLWERAVAVSRYDLAADPVFANNAIFPCQSEAFSWESLGVLKDMVADAKRSLV